MDDTLRTSSLASYLPADWFSQTLDPKSHSAETNSEIERKDGGATPASPPPSHRVHGHFYEPRHTTRATTSGETTAVEPTPRSCRRPWENIPLIQRPIHRNHIVIVCTRCTAHELPCDNKKQCWHCFTANKFCKRPLCETVGKGGRKISCTKPNCNRAHADDKNIVTVTSAQPRWNREKRGKRSSNRLKEKRANENISEAQN